MENAMEKLEEYVLDEDKIVTIASFATDANISLSDAKEILQKYVESTKNSGKIHATYILNGKIKKDQQNYVAIVKGVDLEEKKLLFEDDATETVFSIQKSDKIDYNLIALADPVNEKLLQNPLAGTIVSKNCCKRVIKKRILPPTPAPQSKPSIFGKQTGIKSEGSIKSEKSSIFGNQNGSKSEDNIKSENTDAAPSSSNVKGKSAQGGIANMFSKMSQNKSEESSNNKQEKEKTKTKNSGIAGFFSKMSSSSESISVKKEAKSEEKLISPKKEKKSPKKEEKSPKEETNIKKENSNDDLFDSDSNEEVEKMMMDMDVDTVKEEKPKKTQEKKKPEKKKPVKKRRAKNDENSQSAKRRKRIIVAEDSDSDDIFAADSPTENNDLSEPEEEPEEAAVKKPLPPKNKRRKAVDKTYQDEEGFIVTRTEYIYETASEDENEEPPKQTTPKEKPKSNPLSKKSNSSNSDMDVVEGTPQKGKGGKKGAKKSTSGNQPTLMNFFTKK